MPIPDSAAIRNDSKIISERSILLAEFIPGLTFKTPFSAPNHTLAAIDGQCGVLVAPEIIPQPTLSLVAYSLQSNFGLPFANTVTKAVRCYYEKDLVRNLSVAIDSKTGLFFFQTIRLQLRIRCFGIINLKETSILGRVASIFGQTYPDAVSMKDSGPVRRFIP